MSQKDEVVRKHILNLMCNFKTDFESAELSFEEEEQIIFRLEEMILDDLVEVKKGKLIITEKGKPFVRNICMAFDLRLQQEKPETNLFSQTV